MSAIVHMKKIVLKCNTSYCQNEFAIKMNYCLKALMDKGLVKLENFQNSQHKFNYAYLLTPAGISEKAALTGRFLKRKMAEYEALQAEIEALKAEVGQAATAAASPCRSSTES